MSPTYWTASLLKDAARTHGWDFIKATHPDGPWGMCRGDVAVMVQENRRGGLTWASLIVEGRLRCRLGPERSEKREKVLSWLRAIPVVQEETAVENYAYLVWFQVTDRDGPQSERYEVATASDLDEVLSLIAAAGQPLDRVIVTSPMRVTLRLASGPQYE